MHAEPMTVRDLIAALSTFDPDAEILIPTLGGETLSNVAIVGDCPFGLDTDAEAVCVYGRPLPIEYDAPTPTTD